MSDKSYFMPLATINPEEFYKSGLTKWGLKEIEFFKRERYEFWVYPDDIFVKSLVVVSSLEAIRKLLEENKTHDSP